MSPLVLSVFVSCAPVSARVAGCAHTWCVRVCARARSGSARSAVLPAGPGPCSSLGLLGPAPHATLLYRLPTSEPRPIFHQNGASYPKTCDPSTATLALNLQVCKICLPCALFVSHDAKATLWTIFLLLAATWTSSNMGSSWGGNYLFFFPRGVPQPTQTLCPFSRADNS